MGVLVAACFTQVLAWAQPWIAMWWSDQLVSWMQALEVPGHVVHVTSLAEDITSMPSTRVDVPARDMQALDLAMHAVAAAALWFVAGWLPDAARPAALLLRFGVLVHAASIVYFSTWPASFPYSSMSHAANGLRQVWALMLVTPWLHLCIHYIFPFALWCRLCVTGLTLPYLFVLAPLLYATHLALLHALGLLVMPALYMLFGVMVPLVGLVAIYGWAMTWPRTARRAQW